MGALVAHRIVAIAAVVRTLVIHHVAALVARRTVPVRQWDIRAVGVVRVEDTADHLEEIEQPAFFEGRFDGNDTVSFAQYLVADVRVSDGVVRCRRMGLQGHDIVCRPGIHLMQPAQVQGNTERPQVHVFQDDGFRDN